MFRSQPLTRALLTFGCLAFLACGGSSSSKTSPPSSTGSWNSGGSTSLKGTLAGTETGTLDWSVGATFTPAAAPQGGSHVLPAAANPVAITGTATIGGVVVNITGTFDAANPAAAGSATGSGSSTSPAVTYTFTGSAAGGRLSGSYTTSLGGSGTWSILYVPTGGTVTVYTGTYAHSDNSDNGYFNVEISSAGPVSGNYASATGSGKGAILGATTGASTFGGDIYDDTGAKIGSITTGNFTTGANHTGNVNGTYAVGSGASAKTGGFDGND